MELKVHLVFPGTCEQAFQLYKEALHGEVVFIFRKGDDVSVLVDDAEKEKISHIVLQTEHFTLQGEDEAPGVNVAVNSTKLVLVFRDMKEVERVFNLLAAGGHVVSPLHQEFFTECMGELIDRYGTRWLIMMTHEDYMG